MVLYTHTYTVTVTRTHTQIHTHTRFDAFLVTFLLLCPDCPWSNLLALYQLHFDVAWPFADYLFTLQLHSVWFQKLFLVVQSTAPALPCSPRWAVLKLWASVFLSAEWSCSEIWNWGSSRTFWERRLWGLGPLVTGWEEWLQQRDIRVTCQHLPHCPGQSCLEQHAWLPVVAGGPTVCISWQLLFGDIT